MEKANKFQTIAQVLQSQGHDSNAGMFKGKVRVKWSRESWIPSDEAKLVELLVKYSPAAIRKKAWRLVSKSDKGEEATNKNDNFKL